MCNKRAIYVLSWSIRAISRDVDNQQNYQNFYKNENYPREIPNYLYHCAFNYTLNLIELSQSTCI